MHNIDSHVFTLFLLYNLLNHVCKRFVRFIVTVNRHIYKLPPHNIMYPKLYRRKARMKPSVDGKYPKIK